MLLYPQLVGIKGRACTWCCWIWGHFCYIHFW